MHRRQKYIIILISSFDEPDSSRKQSVCDTVDTLNLYNKLFSIRRYSSVQQMIRLNILTIVILTVDIRNILNRAILYYNNRPLILIV